MFESFYRFDENPFRLNPDEKFRYIHPNYLKAWSYLKYGLDHAAGFVMITGEPGTGKTTLVRSMLSELDPAKYLQVTLVNNQLQAEELLRLLALQFGFNADTFNKATLLTRLQTFASEQYAAGRRVLIIVDEAQNLDPQALEELRLLSNLQVENQALFQIFLIGQEELRHLVLGPGMEQLKQRLVASFRIEAMNATQTEGYIEHRLGVVGWLDDPSLNPSIYPLIYRFTQGIPRKINHILSRLLLYGALEEKHRLDQDDVWTVLEELNDEVRLLPDSSLDFETLRQENRESIMLAETSQQKVAQSDVAVREPLKKEPLSNIDAPLSQILQDQIANEAYYPLNKDKHTNASKKDAPPLLEQGHVPTDLSAPQAKSSSLPESLEGRIILHTQQKTKSESSSIKPTVEQAALDPLPEGPLETESSDSKDLFFKGLERLFQWAAYAVVVAFFAFVFLLPQAKDMEGLWEDVKLQGLQLLGLTHQQRTESRPPLASVTASTTQAQNTGTDLSLRETLTESQKPEEHIRNAPTKQAVTYGATYNKPIDEHSTTRSGITEERRNNPQPEDINADIRPVKSPEPVTLLSPVQPIPTIPVPAQLTDLSLRQPEEAQIITKQADSVIATNQASPNFPGNLKTVDNEDAIRQKELAIRQTAEAIFQSQLESDLTDSKAQSNSRQSALENPKTTDSGTAAVPILDQPQQPKPIPPQRHQVYFKFNRTEISDEYLPVLNSILSYLSSQKKSLVEITGFSDPVGDPVYNKLLSFRRAKEVANFLVDNGISQGRIHITGGGALPAQSEEKFEGSEDRKYKRRVEIKMLAIDERPEP